MPTSPLTTYLTLLLAAHRLTDLDVGDGPLAVAIQEEMKPVAERLTEPEAHSMRAVAMLLNEERDQKRGELAPTLTEVGDALVRLEQQVEIARSELDTITRHLAWLTEHVNARKQA